MVWLMVVAGCSSDVHHLPDGGIVADGSQSPDAMKVFTGTSLTHVLYLNTDGADVKPGPDSAVTNSASYVTMPVSVEPWLVGVSDRLTRISDSRCRRPPEIACAT
jgi:hypothetical protein